MDCNCYRCANSAWDNEKLVCGKADLEVTYCGYPPCGNSLFEDADSFERVRDEMIARAIEADTADICEWADRITALCGKDKEDK